MRQHFLVDGYIPVSTDTRGKIKHSGFQRHVKNYFAHNAIQSATMAELRTCGFCGDVCLGCTIEFGEPDNGNIPITNIVYPDDKHLCQNKNCPRKALKLNGNSVEFIKKAFKLNSDAEAIEIIHGRNSSPFYRRNHGSQEAYDNYQNVFLGLTTEARTDCINKQNYSRSLAGYIDKFGVDIGTAKWEEAQKAKAITLERMQEIHGIEEGLTRYESWKAECKCSLENFIRRHGEELGQIKYTEWKSKISQTLENYINRHGEILGPEKHRLWHQKIIPTLENFIKKSSGDIRLGTARYNAMCQQHRDNSKNRLFGTKVVKYGLIFYSKLELNFYEQLIEIFPDVQVEHDVPYAQLGHHGIKYRSDFYFPTIETHIEIAGLMRLPHYAKKMQMKKELFGAIIVTDAKDNVKTIQHILELHNEIKFTNNPVD